MTKFNSIPLTDPEKEATDIYHQYSEFEDLNTDEVKKCCYIAIRKLMESSDTLGKVYWGEVKRFIKER